jgi:DNA-binding XRE family transcriptional regulator
MSHRSDPAELLARELLRESLFLPERWRVWLYERLREDLPEVDWEQHRIDLIGARMSAAISSLDRVADHLGLEDQKAQLRLTIREFDAAPESVREGWRARQVANVLRGSWTLAKGIAFTDQRLPVAAEVYWKRAEGLARKLREGAFTLGGVQAWLDTKPKKKTRGAYDAWAKARNKELGEGKRRPIPLGKALGNRWRVPLAEIIKAVEEGRIPGEDPDALLADNDGHPDHPEDQRPDRPLNLDPEFQAQRIRAAREARGLSMRELADRASVDASQLGRIEKGHVRNPTFETLAKLANTLGLSLDELAAGPSPS